MGNKFKQIIKRELLYYVIILVVLALIMHIDLLSDPFSRIESMKEKENYSHPILYSFAIYVIILVIRKAIDLVVGIFQKK